jgi:hypothetical protein
MQQARSQLVDESLFEVWVFPAAACVSKGTAIHWNNRMQVVRSYVDNLSLNPTLATILLEKKALELQG